MKRMNEIIKGPFMKRTAGLIRNEQSEDRKDIIRRIFPLIHIMGLPGAGKTTLAGKLARKWNIPVYRIGDYRARYPSTALGEADVWLALFRDLSRRRWQNCILETTGLNKRESFLKAALPPLQRLTVKLEARRHILYQRIRLKKKSEQGGEWFFSLVYPDKYEFVRKSLPAFRNVPADYRIDTSQCTENGVYRKVLGQLELDALFGREMKDGS
jgi:hypothetical protein